MLWFMRFSASATLFRLACPGCAWGTLHCLAFPSKRYRHGFPVATDLSCISRARCALNLFVPGSCSQQQRGWIPLHHSLNGKEDTKPPARLSLVTQLLLSAAFSKGFYKPIEDKTSEIDIEGYCDWFVLIRLRKDFCQIFCLQKAYKRSKKKHEATSLHQRANHRNF